MGTYTGTAGNDLILPGYVSEGVGASPAGTRPGTAADTIYGNAGDDAIDAGGGDDVIDGGEGNDTVTGGAGNDSIRGHIGEDFLVGGGGNDTLWGSSEADTLVGGTGDDLYFADENDALVESAGGGSDTVSVTTASYQGAFFLGAFFENLIIADFSDGYGNHSANILRATSYGYNGTLFGLGGNDTLYSGYGDYTLVGGRGDDVYYLEYEASVIEGSGGGIDTTYVEFQDYDESKVYALAENLENAFVEDIQGYDPDEGFYYFDSTILGNSSANAIAGGYGDNEIDGFGGADSLFGSDGDDTLDGGGGSDRLDGGGGSDTILYTTNTTSVRVDLAAGQVTFSGQSFLAETVISIENAETGTGHDTFIGNAAANRYFGNAGNDSFTGAGANDSARGGGGNDTLRGGAGNDTLRPDGGADVIVGGSGNDVFRFVFATHSKPGAVDRLVAGDGGAALDRPGAAAGDLIDLSEIDADIIAAGNQAFIFDGTRAIGRMWLEEVGNVTHVRAQTDNLYEVVEFDLAIEDGVVRASDYTVDDFNL